MKLRSGRQYKNDLSDVPGILAEHEKQNRSITIDQIRKAVINLYGSWDVLPESSIDFIENVMKRNDFKILYSQVSESEKRTKAMLIRFDKVNPGVVKGTNAADISTGLQKQAKRIEIYANAFEIINTANAQSPSENDSSAILKKQIRST